MLVKSNKRWHVNARFADADAVFLLGDFNAWSTTATPLQRTSDDEWEVALPTAQDTEQLRFFVWRRGAIGGRLYRVEQAPTEPAATRTSADSSRRLPCDATSN